MKYNAIKILLLSLIVIPSLSSCASKSDVNNDNDFDGLINSIDPDPNNNKYNIGVVNRDGSIEKYESSTLEVTVDYRNLIEHKYNSEIAKFASFCIYDSLSEYKCDFKNNRYPKEKDTSLVSPILTQIGCENIVEISLLEEGYVEDIYDLSNIYMGHHTFSTNNGNKYQVFFALINPYPDRSGWVSNLDVGAANPDGSLTDGYKAFSDELHTDWKDKLNHKGFDVTSNRVLRKIKQYEENYINKNAHQITFITGHSRGGAITNLVAKLMIDEGYDVRAYTFNTPNNTTASESVRLNPKYDDIHNFINNDDFVSLVPCKDWGGFNIYGRNIYRIDVDANKFKSFTHMDYKPLSKNALNGLINLFSSFATSGGVKSRENVYEFRDKSSDFEEAFTFDDLESANEHYDDLLHYFEKSPEAKSSFAFSKPELVSGSYKIFYKTKLSLLIALLVDTLGRHEYSSILEYIDVSGRIIHEFIDYLNGLKHQEFSISGFKIAHSPPLASLMADQYKPS